MAPAASTAAANTDVYTLTIAPMPWELKREVVALQA